MMNVTMTDKTTNKTIFSGNVKDLNSLADIFCKQDTNHISILIVEPNYTLEDAIKELPC